MLTDTDFVMPDTDQNAADRRLNVRFSLQPRLDSAKTAETGAEVYRDVEFVTILIPGDKTLSVHRPVQASDKQRFPEMYRAFKTRGTNATSGTPLASWAMVTPGQRQELAYFNVTSIEQLAEMADGAANNMMGVQKLKADAQKFLKAQRDNAGTTKLMKELEQRDNAIAALQAQVTELAALAARAPLPSPK